MPRRRWLGGLAAALLLVGLAVLATREPSRPAASEEREVTGELAKSPSAKRRAETEPIVDESKVRRSPRKLDPEEQGRRAQVREQILAAERARRGTQRAGEGSPPPSAETDERPPGNLTNRLEGHDDLVAELNRDFMPLASECIEEALGRDPELTGMLAIEFEVVADEDLGAIVDTVEFPENDDQVVQDELHVCVRETLLSTLLPAHDVNGREALMLTLEVGEQAESSPSPTSN